MEADTRAAAIAGWNARPEADALRAENERLRTALVQAREWIGTRSTAIRFDHFANGEVCIHCRMTLGVIGGRERHAAGCARQKALAACNAALEGSHE